MTLAIDFGTSNTVVARWNAATQAPELVNLPPLSLRQGGNPPLIPSLVYLQDIQNAQVIAGQVVRDRGLDTSNDPRFFRNFKRGIGSEVQGFLPELDGCSLSFETIGSCFLKEVIQSIRQVPLPMDSLVFTVPVDSFESYRHWLGGVAASLNVERVQMLDEPTAAALGYGLSDRELLLVIDFGGGTLDLSLVRLNASTTKASKPVGFVLKWGEKLFSESSGQQVKTAQVLAKAGQNLGGADIDHWLTDYFCKTQNLKTSPLITRLAERLKIQLSLQTQATEVFFDDTTFESYEFSLSRAEFDQILQKAQFFERLNESMTQVLQQAQRQGITPDDIDAVLLVGGTAQIPAVQDWIESYFPSNKIRRDQPFEAIALGALQLDQGLELKDFLYHSYGVRYWDRRLNRHNWHPIIPAGQVYPMPEPIELVLGASTDNQPSIELIIGELGVDTGQTEIYFDGDRLVTRTLTAGQPLVQPLNDREGARSIANLDPLGFPGCDRIRIQFQVDAQRFLRMSVEDMLTHQTLVTNQSIVQLS